MSINLQSIEFGFIVKILNGNQYIDFNKTKIEKTMLTDPLARNLYSFIGKQISTLSGFTPQLHIPIFLKIEGMEDLYNQFKKNNNYNFEYTSESFTNYLQTFVDLDKDISYYEGAISEEYTRREMEILSEEMIELAQDRKKTSMELLRKISVKLDNLLYKGNDEIEACSADDLFEDEFEYANDGVPDKYVPTGIEIIDDETGGLTSPSTTYVLANPKAGKAQSLDSIIYTPDGYKTFAEINIGDEIFNENGEICTVTNIPFNELADSYKVYFNDGTFIECSSGHLWTVEDNKFRHNKEKTIITKETKELLNMGLINTDRLRFRIPISKPINFKTKEIKIDSYLLGTLLGDGSMSKGVIQVRLTNSEEDVIYKSLLSVDSSLYSKRWIDNKNSYDITFLKNSKVKENLKYYNLFGKSSKDKFIPKEYLFNSIDIRLRLLQGLFDTDGCVEDNKLLKYYTTSKQLSEDVCFLVRSLGGMCRLTEKKAVLNNKNYGICYGVTMAFDNGIIPFSSKKHKDKYNGRIKPVSKSICKIEKIENKIMKCITTSSPSGLYLTNDFIVTHNSTELYNIALKNLIQGRTVMFATIETNMQESRRKMLSAYTGIEYKKIQNKTYTQDEKLKYLEGLKDFHTKFKDKFFLIYNKNGMSCKDIEIHWNNYKKAGFRCEDIVIDQLVLLKANDEKLSMVEAMVKKPQEVRILSQKTDTRVFTASQLRDDVIGKDISKINTDDIWFAKTIGQEATAIVVLHLDGESIENGELKMKSLPSRCGYSSEIYHFPDVDFNKMTLGKAKVWTGGEKII